jgi:hypothetical protein
VREILYQGLIASTDLAAELELTEGETIEDRIHQASSLTTRPRTPFVTFRMHTHFPRQGVGQREYCQIWANDDPGDYLRIDRILKQCRIALESLQPNGEFLEARWIETGVDLKDDDMGTINRYIRLQFTGTLREREEV